MFISYICTYMSPFFDTNIFCINLHLIVHPHYSSIIMSYMAYDLGKCIRELGNAMSKSLIKVSTLSRRCITYAYVFSQIDISFILQVFVAQAIQALSYIHGCDLVHDNLRPEHLFVDLENNNITIGGLSHAHSPNFAASFQRITLFLYLAIIQSY